MIFNPSRDELRQHYRKAWQKHLEKKLLSPLEAQIVDVVALHPEYQAEILSDKHYIPEHGETNPFLHLGLHIAIQEQIQTNRPNGIVQLYKNLLTKHQDAHQVEHLMMDCLAESLWLAQRNQQAPDEIKYLQQLKDLL